jgi:osmoprotectant transport system substrate-binding protein
VRRALTRAALLLVAGVLLTGCDLHGALLEAPDAPTAATTTTGGSGVDPSQGTSTQATGTTDGPATTGTGSSTTATTATAPALPGTGRPTIAVGDENTPEQFVLGELYRIALSDQGYTVTITQNIGTPTTSEQALTQGTLDLYPAYLNQWDTWVASDSKVFRTSSQALVAGQRFALANGMELLTPTPFGDTEGLAVSSQYAGQHDLRSLADLSTLSDLFTLGAPLEFSAPGGGLSAIEQAYAFIPSGTEPVDVGGQYQELEDGTINAAFVQTTDWQLATGQFTLLRDTRHILGFGNVVPVTTTAAAIAAGPAFIPTINKVSSLLTTRVMRQLNQQVAFLGENPEDVASAFLESHGIYPPAD